MCKFKYMILVIIVISFLGCSKSDDGGSGGSGITLSAIQVNVKSNSKFITTKNSNSSSRNNLNYFSTWNTNRSSSSADSLITFDDNGNLDYGIISSYNIMFDQVVALDIQSSIAILNYSDVNTWRYIIDLNCGIIQIEADNKNTSCLIYGIPPTNISKHFRMDADTYGKNPFQKNDNYLYFRSEHTDDNNVENSLKCSGSCVYSYNLNTKEVKKLSRNDISVEKFILLNNNDLIYRGIYPEITLNDGNKESGILYIVNNAPESEFEIPNTSVAIGDVNNGSEQTLLFSKTNNYQQYAVFFRLINNSKKYSYIKASIPEIFTTIKGEDGNIYAHTKDGLYSLLPFKSTAVISKPYTVDNVSSSEDCYLMLTCSIFFKVFENVIIYNHIDFSLSQKPTLISAKRISDNKTVTILKPDNSCSKNCFKIDNANINEESPSPYTKWYSEGNNFYIPMYDLVNKKNTIITIDLNNIDFDSNTNQFSEMSNLDEFLVNKNINNISSHKGRTNSDNFTAEILHETNDNKSIRIKFNNYVNYKLIEKNIEISDNLTNETVTFMPIWNGKSIHLVVDTSIGSDQDYTENVLTTGRTYKITLSGSAKDSDGNTLGSDVVKYITP